MASGSHVPLDGSNVTDLKISSTRLPSSRLSSALSPAPPSPLIGTYALPDFGASLLDEWQGELDCKDSERPFPSGTPPLSSSSHTPIEGDPPKSNFDVDARPSAPTLSSIPTPSPKSPVHPDHETEFMSRSISVSSFPQKLDPPSDINIPQNTQSSTETAIPSNFGTQLQTSILHEPSSNPTTHFPEILPFSRMFSRANREARLSSSSKESSSNSRLEKGQHSGLRPWPRVSMWSQASPVLQHTGETNSTELPTFPAVVSPGDSARQRRLSADISAAEAFRSRGSWQRGVAEELLRLSEGRDSLSRSSSRRTTGVASIHSRSRLSSVREFRHNRDDTLDAHHARRHRALSDGENGIFRRSSVSSLRKQLGLSGKLNIARTGGPNVDVLRDGLNIGGAIRVSTFRRGSLPAYTKPRPASELDGPSAVTAGESDLVPGEIVPPLTRTAAPSRLTDISDTLKTVGSHSHKARHHSLPSTVPSNASASSTSRPHRISTVNFASLEPSTGKRKERGGDHDNEEFVPTSVRLVSPPATLPRGILKSSSSMMPSAFTDLSSDRQSKRLKLSLSSPPVAADFFREPASSSHRSLSRLSENNNQSVEQHANFQETPSLPSQPSFGAQSSTVVSHSGPPASYSPSFSSTRVSSQNDHRRTSISSRLTSGGAPIPMRAFLSPRPPSIVGNQLSEYHMQDPSLHLRYSKTEQSGLAPRQIEVLRWWQKPSIHGWCFILGFIFPPLWWAGAFFLRPRHVVLSRLKDNDLIEEWNEQDQVALTWRFRCRLMGLFSLLIYTPIIVLAIVFGS